MDREQITQILFRAIDEVNEQLPGEDRIKKSLTTILSGNLDSLSLVVLATIIEEKIDINLDEGMITGNLDSYKTVGSLVDYISSYHKPSRKLIIVDLDNTLWKGIVGEDGWENILVHKQLQKDLKALSKKGVLLAIASKNNEVVALEAISKHSDMILTLADFVTWRINWDKKSKNILDILSELNLGAASAVFIDDSPVERDEVKQFLPEVIVLETLDTTFFNVESLTAEDVYRLQMYRHEKERKALLSSDMTRDEWIASLQTVVTSEELIKENLPRTVQLLNKTNQMNLATRRMGAKELWAWSQSKGHKLFTFRVSDKFGDSGLVGILSLNLESGEIVDFVLSCRVMGRGVEETMLAHIKTVTQKKLWAKYIKTDRNEPCFDFWMNRSGFEYKNGVFI